MRSNVRWKVRLIVYGGLVLVVLCWVLYCTWMPGESAQCYRPNDVDVATADRLRATVTQLVALGPRNLHSPRGYQSARSYLTSRLEKATGKEVRSELVAAARGDSFNLIVEWGKDEPGGWLIVGAHYDTAFETPGGNDNGSGVAVALELARRLREDPPRGRVRIVLFANEEPPHFWTEEMGSLVHARGCEERGEEIRGMVSLETLGFYSEKAGSQKYPPPIGLLYPDTGNFVAFVGNMSSRALISEAIGLFRQEVAFPSEGGAFPGAIPGIGWSDHWSFWQVGAPAFMITDTAPFRDQHYHEKSDRTEHIDLDRLAVVTDGVEAVVRGLARSKE